MCKNKCGSKEVPFCVQPNIWKTTSWSNVGMSRKCVKLNNVICICRMLKHTDIKESNISQTIDSVQHNCSAMVQAEWNDGSICQTGFVFVMVSACDQVYWGFANFLSSYSQLVLPSLNIYN